VEKIQTEELEQLKIVFRKILGDYIDIIRSWNIDVIVNKLLCEVKIRIK